MSMRILTPFRSRKTSFENSIRPHLKEMYYQAYRLLKNQSEAEDLVHDFVLRLYKNQAKLHEIEHLRSWLYKGLYRQFLNFIRDNKRNPLNSLDYYEDNEEESFAYHHFSPELIAEHDMEIERVQAVLSELAPIHHQIILMHDIEGFTLAEIANIIECPVGTLKSRLHRARENLKSKLIMEPISNNQCV